MEQENKFTYTYSAMENQEVQSIRKKYLAPQEDKLDELKRLDQLVQNSGMTTGLCVGTIGAMIFGLGLCLAMKVIGQWPGLGVAIGLIGLTGVVAAFPAYRKVHEMTKAEHTPRILQLADELAGCN